MNRPAKARIPEPTAADLKTWGRLVERAARCAAEPAVPVGDLQLAVNAAKLCVVPDGPPTAGHPFIRLHRTALRFVHETRQGRAGLAADLAAIAADCRARLAGEAPARPFRADIDG